MDNIIFGIPTKRVARRETLNYPAFILQEAPTEKGKAYKMQFSDPAIELMGLDIDAKPTVAVASVNDSVFLVAVTDQIREQVPQKDICMVYADGSLSNKRLFNYLVKTFELNPDIKNTFTLERAQVSGGAPGVEPITMFKLLRAQRLDEGQRGLADATNEATESQGPPPADTPSWDGEGPSSSSDQPMV